MKFIKRIITFFSLCLLLSCLSMLASADSMITIENVGTLSNIESSLKNTQADESLTDSNKIQQIISLLFDAKREQLANTELVDFDFSIFGEMSGLQYFSRSIKAQKETYNVLNLTLNNCRTELTFENIEISGNIAQVNVYEWFSFYYNTMPDNESGEGFDYEILLQKNEAGWAITSIDFSNQATEALRNPDVDISAFVQNRYTAANTFTPSSVITTFGNSENTVTAARNTNYTSFSRVKFLTYALQYDGSARNPNFMDCTDMGGDCQNFASQCIWAALGGENSSLTGAGIPMINPTVAGSSGRAWYIFPNGTHSASWTSCTYFGNYISAGRSSTLGLHGSIYSGIAFAETGDVIHIRNSAGTYYHAYVVVSTSGTYGSRTLSDIYVSAHTEDRAYELLSTFLDDPVLRTIHIRGLVS